MGLNEGAGQMLASFRMSRQDGAEQGGAGVCWSPTSPNELLEVMGRERVGKKVRAPPVRAPWFRIYFQGELERLGQRPGSSVRVPPRRVRSCRGLGCGAGRGRQSRRFPSGAGKRLMSRGLLSHLWPPWPKSNFQP